LAERDRVEEVRQLALEEATGLVGQRRALRQDLTHSRAGAASDHAVAVTAAARTESEA
jgi:hypothetical protein